MADLGGKNKILKEYIQREKFDQFEDSSTLQKSKIKVNNIEADDKSSQSEDLLATQDDKKVNLQRFEDSDRTISTEDAIIDSANNKLEEEHRVAEVSQTNNKEFNSYINEESQQNTTDDNSQDQTSNEETNNKITTNFQQDSTQQQDNNVELKPQTPQEQNNFVGSGVVVSPDGFIGINYNPKDLPRDPVISIRDSTP